MASPKRSSAELFHTLTERDSAAARRRVVELGIEDRVDFRNVGFQSHRQALQEHHGSTTPAIWDGTHLHQGLEAVLALLNDLKAR